MRHECQYCRSVFMLVMRNGKLTCRHCEMLGVDGVAVLPVVVHGERVPA